VAVTLAPVTVLAAVQVQVVIIVVELGIPVALVHLGKVMLVEHL
jgi:hypothetical protein